MVTCYIAQSLDGYIATPDGGLDWLPQPSSNGEDYGFADFYRGIDGILMGRKTFEIVQVMQPWPHSDRSTLVFTHKLSTDVDKLPINVSFVTQEPIEVLKGLSLKGMNHLWLVGGAELISAFREHHLIDEFIITTIPVVLGKGIPLFLNGDQREFWCCTKSKCYESGITQSTFVRIP